MALARSNTETSCMRTRRGFEAEDHRKHTSSEGVSHGPNRIRARQGFWKSIPAVNQLRRLRPAIENDLDSLTARFIPGIRAPVVDIMQDRDVSETQIKFAPRV
jgi:hypothetical protein